MTTEEKYTSGPSIGEYWNISGVHVPVLPENVIFRSLERAGVYLKLTILERKNGLVVVLFNTCLPVSRT